MGMTTAGSGVVVSIVVVMIVVVVSIVVVMIVVFVSGRDALFSEPFLLESQGMRQKVQHGISKHGTSGQRQKHVRHAFVQVLTREEGNQTDQ